MPRHRRKPSVAALIATLREAPQPWSRAVLEDRWSGRTLAEAVRLGHAVRIAPGQYAHRTHAADLTCRLAAVTAWMAPHGTISGLAALWLRGWRGTEPSRVDVVLPRDVKLAKPPYVDTFRADRPPLAETIDGTPVVTSPEAALLAWRRSPPHARRGLLLDLIRDGAVDPEELDRRVGATRRVPDRAALNQVTALARDGVQSMLEYLAATEVFHGREWADWTRQGDIAVGAVTLHPDLVHFGARVAIELDSQRFHSNDGQRRRDIERDALLASVGFVVIRLTWEDITRRPQWCRARVRETLRARTF
ncbi:endonuclease domain-containing protein [uncultured Demequina sp.]|uniref:endonuclease domain-containing protein n=1 Tax=uncultured Demequina sp. TaxID=693499 RepID=UPI0025CD9108|nr:DUF559 domain-containing protein [uncultured Demequina sp.]